ncbi:MAG: LPS export ABC transporter permease LptG [Proteobacteria bacterium]|nr:LPS export ABC transporter permease LptG [Pseudomonadota bacterium]
MRLLRGYLGREVLLATLVIFGALVMLFGFFDLIQELADVGRGGYTFTAAVIYVVLHLPSRMYELFPVAALIGTLFAIAQLVANSEYTVMRASGMSLLQTSWAVLRIGIPLALITFLAGEYVAPQAERMATTLRAASRGDASQVMAQQFQSGFWFKQDQTFVNIRSVLADMTLVGVHIYEFDRDMRLTRLRVAEAGHYDAARGQWRLDDVQTTEISPTATTVSHDASWTWDTVLRPSILNVYQVAPERLELDALYDNIHILSQNAQKTSRFEIAFWNKVLYPATVLVMMLLALPFAHFQRRAGGVGVRIFVGTMLGLAFFLIGRLFANLGVLNDWPPLFSALFPLCVFAALAAFMMYRMERR